METNLHSHIQRSNILDTIFSLDSRRFSITRRQTLGRDQRNNRKIRQGSSYVRNIMKMNEDHEVKDIVSTPLVPCHSPTSIHLRPYYHQPMYFSYTSRRSQNLLIPHFEFFGVR